jgi:BioD-like phosphotransacetylase family protein
MASVLVVSPEQLHGKTTVAVALGQRLAAEDKKVALLRLEGDAHGASDASVLAGLSFNAKPQAEPVAASAAKAGGDVTIVEAPAGDAREQVAALGAKVVVALAYSDPLSADMPSFCRAFGDACLGVVITRVPAPRGEATWAAAEGVGVPLLGLLPEDRTLAAPSLRAIVEALEAEVSHVNGAGDRVIESPVVSSISTDPSQEYFVQREPSAVIVRGDKPDQQLGALNAGAPCLIVTGGLPVLSYVLQRAEEEEVPILSTKLDTVAVVERLESLYAMTPFTGQAKIDRLAELAAGLDASTLT